MHGQVLRDAGDDRRQRQDGQRKDAGEQKEHAQRSDRRKPVADASANVIPQADASQHDTDDACPGVQRDAEIRRDHPPRRKLDDQSTEARYEDYRARPPDAAHGISLSLPCCAVERGCVLGMALSACYDQCFSPDRIVPIVAMTLSCSHPPERSATLW